MDGGKEVGGGTRGGKRTDRQGSSGHEVPRSEPDRGLHRGNMYGMIFVKVEECCRWPQDSRDRWRKD